MVSIRGRHERRPLIAFLLLALVGILIAYPFMAGANLPSLVYTRSQQEFLNDNRYRVIAQAPATWNFLPAVGVAGEGGGVAGEAAGPVVTAIFPKWENNVRATLDARYEEQDGVSVTVYDLDFTGEYRLKSPETATSVELIFPFPAHLDTLHNVRLLVNGAEPSGVEYSTQQIRWQTEMTPGRDYDIVVSYSAEGVGRFEYGLYKDRRLDKLNVNIEVKGLAGAEVLNTSLPTTADPPSLSGETFTWGYTNLIANRDIQIELPQRLSFAQRVAALRDDFYLLSMAAPFLVGFFLLSLAGLLWLEKLHLELEVYLLMGLALALFYPLLTFLSGLVVWVVSSILAVLAIFLLQMVFLSAVAGWRQIGLRVAWLLFIFTVVFSLGLLMPLRGLLLTVGGLLLVGTFMMAYVRRPREVEPKHEPESPLGPESLSAPATQVTAVNPPGSTGRYCPTCAHVLESDYQFCPQCGYNLRLLHRCDACGYEQWVPVDVENPHCLSCGAVLT